MNKEELLKALNVVKKVCAEMEHCYNCPLRKEREDICYIQDIMPEKWKVKRVVPIDWRAFYD